MLKQIEKKAKSFFAGKIFFDNGIALLAGKLSLEKKVCAFEWCLVLSQKFTKSLGGKNLALCNVFLPSKAKVYIWFLARHCPKSAEFFFFSATLPSQKIVKEIAYIPTSFQAPFKSALFLFNYALNKKDNKQMKQ